MKILQLPKGQGKTTQLLNYANDNDVMVITYSKQRARELFNMAREAGLIHVSYPILMKQALQINKHHSHGFVVDDMDEVLNTTLGGKVEVATIRTMEVDATANEDDFSRLSKHTKSSIIKVCD